ncbi:uncharacterized protein LOC111132208 [Crassostrea virginica]
MMKNPFYNVSSVGNNESVYIYPLDGSVSLLGPGTKDLVVHRLRPPPGGVKSKQVVYHGVMKYRSSENSKTDKQRKGILKNSSGNPLNGHEGPSQKLDVSKIQCVLKKRKTSANEKQSNSSHGSKSQKKVKFDDKLNKLTELGMKYAVDTDMRIRPVEHTSHIRRQHQVQRASFKVSPGSEKSRDTVKISNVYDLRDSSEHRALSPRSKSTSTNSGSVNRRTSGDSYPLIETDAEDFVRVEFCEDRVIPTYNPRESAYQGDQGQGHMSEAHPGDPNNRLIENGIPVFTKTGKFVRTTKINGLPREKKTDNENEENLKPEKPSYRLASEPNRKDISNPVKTETKRASSAQKSSTKTTTNSSSGAKITRSNVKPFMFTRYSTEKDRQSTTRPIADTQRNFCDDGKTYDIIKWLTNVKDIQSSEGFSSFHIEHSVH